MHAPAHARLRLCNVVFFLCVGVRDVSRVVLHKNALANSLPLRCHTLTVQKAHAHTCNVCTRACMLSAPYNMRVITTTAVLP